VLKLETKIPKTWTESFVLLSCSGWGAKTSVKEQELKFFFSLKKFNTEEFVDFSNSTISWWQLLTKTDVNLELSHSLYSSTTLCRFWPKCNTFSAWNAKALYFNKNAYHHRKYEICDCWNSAASNWCINTWDMTFVCLRQCKCRTWLFSISDMTHLHVGHDSWMTNVISEAPDFKTIQEVTFWSCSFFRLGPRKWLISWISWYYMATCLQTSFNLSLARTCARVLFLCATESQCAILSVPLRVTVPSNFCWRHRRENVTCQQYSEMCF